MAIEDAYQLAGDLSTALDICGGDPDTLNVAGVLQDYQRQRLVRASVIHGMAGMAAFMASTYKVRAPGGSPETPEHVNTYTRGELFGYEHRA